MIFFIVLIVCLILALTVCVVVHNRTCIDCETGIGFCIITLSILIIVFVALMINRKHSIYIYNECKTYPEYFSNEERKKNNEVIADIKAFQGTILSFYNGIEFEYFEIEDGQKVIVNEGEIK